MIVKSLSRKSGSGQLVKYICRYILDEKKQSITKGSFIIRHNIRGATIASYVKEFKANDANRLFKRKDQAVIQHVILSWHTKDSKKITDAMLRDLTKQYIKLRGENNLYVGTKHTDREHIHMHLAMSAVQLNGRSNRISKAEFAQLKVHLDTYQKEKYPQLFHSLPKHSKQNNQSIVINLRHTRKEALAQLLKDTYAATQSKEDFLLKLQEQHLEPYYRNGHLQGIKDGNLKFRFNRLDFAADQLDDFGVIRSTSQSTLDDLRSLRQRSQERSAEVEKARERTMSTDDSDTTLEGLGGIPTTAFRNITC